MAYLEANSSYISDSICSCPHSSSFNLGDSGILSRGQATTSSRCRSNHVISTNRLPLEVSPSCNDEDSVGFGSVLSLPSTGTDTCGGARNTKSAEELTKEITTIESEILKLERYLLSLYRTAFEEKRPSPTNASTLHFLRDIESPPVAVANQSYVQRDVPRKQPQCETESSSQAVATRTLCSFLSEEQRGGLVHDEQPSPVNRCVSSDTLRCTSSLNLLSIKDQMNVDSGRHRLADLLGASYLLENVSTPHKLSEDIVRCISSIYCRLANTAPSSAGVLSSPTSSLSSSSRFSSQTPCDTSSMSCNEDTIMDHQLQGSKGDNWANTTTAEVQILRKICIDDGSFSYATLLLTNFRSLVKNLENVDPGNMKREEKLAFWINIYNALVMHAYLAYGSRNCVAKTSVLKAAYNVGGHTVNACIIESSILQIRSRNSEPWLQTLLSPGKKAKTGNSRHVYALDYPEPLVHFALCSGSYSDPMVRVYTAKNVFQELRHAKDEFIRANIYNKEEKIYVPKLVMHFAKDMSVGMDELLESMSECMRETQQKAMREFGKKKLEKSISWLPQSSVFRYVIHEDLCKGRV